MCQLGDEIELISDGDGLAVIGDPAAVERFLSSAGVPSKDLQLHQKLGSALNAGSGVAQAGSQLAANSHWLGAYDPDQHASAPIGWHHDFADARQRLHDWVASCGTRLDRDRATRQTSWPGEPSADAVDDLVIRNRDEDFVIFVLEDVERRREAGRVFYSATAAGSV